jgi:hypothetical protein
VTGTRDTLKLSHPNRDFGDAAADFPRTRYRLRPPCFSSFVTRGADILDIVMTSNGSAGGYLKFMNVIEIWSRDDAILVRSGASIAAPLRLVSVGPFHEAFGTAVCQRDIHLGQPFNIGGTNGLRWELGVIPTTRIRPYRRKNRFHVSGIAPIAAPDNRRSDDGDCRSRDGREGRSSNVSIIVPTPLETCAPVTVPSESTHCALASASLMIDFVGAMTRKFPNAASSVGRSAGNT